MKRKIISITFFLLLLLGSSQQVVAIPAFINDGSFELGVPNAAWNESSTNFGTPICNTGSCGYGTGTGPRTGSYWAWFGGIPAAEVGSIDQTITIPNGLTQLHFWLQIPAVSGSGNDYLQVQIDDVPITTIYENNILYSQYNEAVVDISAFDDGNPHKIEFYSVSYGSGTTNFFVDDISLTTPPPIPVNWISILSVFLIIGAITVFRFNKNRTLILNK